MREGFILLFAGAAAPEGWLVCEGQSLSITTYAVLFAIIGYTFGGSGANFNVPDFRDRFAIGVTTGKNLGATGGGSVTILIENLPPHVHSISSDGDHRHNYPRVPSGSGSTFFFYLAETQIGSEMTITSSAGGDHTHILNTTGNDVPASVVASYLSLNYIIKYY
jgi:microcystin-dependent protein